MRSAIWAPDCGRPTLLTSLSAWYPALVRPDLGIGPHRVWWISDLKAAGDPGLLRGRLAGLDARSYALPDRSRSVHHRGGIAWQFDPTPGEFVELVWHEGGRPPRQPTLTLSLRGIESLTVDLTRAGFGPDERGSVTVATDSPVTITFRGQSKKTVFSVDDGAGAKGSVALPAGRHRIGVAPAAPRQTRASGPVRGGGGYLEAASSTS